LLEQGMQLAFSDLFRDIFQGVACELIRTLTQRPEVVRPGPTDRDGARIEVLLRTETGIAAECGSRHAPKRRVRFEAHPTSWIPSGQ
jgi:hypothetical protein